MTDQELRKLRRTDLLELLLAQEKENEELRRRVEQLQICLEERELTMVNAGSIAEASMQLNGVFQAAQAAAGGVIAVAQARPARAAIRRIGAALPAARVSEDAGA